MGASTFRQKVVTVTWLDVARTLRACLWARAETIQWLAFARVFMGAIEQRILGFGPLASGTEQRPAPGSAGLLELLKVRPYG